MDFFQFCFLYMNLKVHCTKQVLSTVIEVNPGESKGAAAHVFTVMCFPWLGGLILHPCSFLRLRKVLT